MPTPLNARQVKKKIRQWVEAGANHCELQHVTSLHDFYEQVHDQISTPEESGKNLDALYDTLANNIEGPLLIVWRDFEESRKAMGDEDHSRLCSVLIQVQQDRDDCCLILSDA